MTKTVQIWNSVFQRFSGNVSYFGLTFMSTSLSGNRFLNYTLSAAVEFFAYVINIFIVRRYADLTLW